MADDKVTFYMEVSADLRDRFKEACKPSTMTEITQYLWRVFVNAPEDDQLKTMKEAVRHD